MKIRNGFVSNSSSSSFVLILDEVSPQGVRDILTPGTPDNVVFEIVRDLERTSRSAWDAPEPVEIKAENISKITSTLDMAENSYDDYFRPTIAFEDAYREYRRGNLTWAELEKTLTNEESERILSQFPGKILACVDYGDECNEGYMEHGPHWRAGVESGRVLWFSHH